MDLMGMRMGTGRDTEYEEGESDIDDRTEDAMNHLEDLLKQVSSPDLMKQAMSLGIMGDLSQLRRSIIFILTSRRFVFTHPDFVMIIDECQNMLGNVFLLDQPSQQQQQQQQQEQRRRCRQKIRRFISRINPAKSRCIARPYFRRMVNRATKSYDRSWRNFGTSRPELNFEDARDGRLNLEADATILDIVRWLLTGSYATQVKIICSTEPEPGGNFSAKLMTELTRDWRVQSYFLQQERICVSKLFDSSMSQFILPYGGTRSLLVLEDDVPDSDEKIESWKSLLEQCRTYLKFGSRVLVTTQNITLAEKIGASFYRLPVLKLDENGHWFSDWAGKRLLHFYCSLMLPHDHTLHTLCEEDLFDIFSAMGFLIIPSQLFYIEEESIRNRYLQDLKDMLGDLSNFSRGSMPHTMTHYRIINSEDLNQMDQLGTFRYLSINKFPQHVDEGYIFEKLESLKRQELLTVLIFTDVKSSENFKIQNRVPRDLSSTCTNLRVLSLQDSGIKSLPECLCTLFSLRYLNLSKTRIKTLPKSIGNLQNLQALKLSHCRRLRELPESISYLVSLQKLDLESCYRLSKLPDHLSDMLSLKRLIIQGCYYLSHMPSDMGIMYNLVILSNYCLSEGTDEREPRNISELRELDNLHGTLHIENLNIVKKPEDARGALLSYKLYLRSLVLQWNPEDMEEDATERRDVQNSVLQELQPSSYLQSLKIISYTGTCFPPWMMNDIETSLQHLVEIRLINLKTCKSLPPLGKLQNLKEVEISGMDAIESLDEDFCGKNGTFPALEKLTISQMPNLEKWSSIDMWIYVEGMVLFPHLTHLNIIQCPKLEMLPSHLPFVKELALWMNNEKLYSTEESLKGLSGSLEKLSIYFVQDYFSFSMFQGLKWSTVVDIEIFECKPMPDLLSNIEKCLSRFVQLTLKSCENLEGCSKRLGKYLNPRVLDCPSYS